MELEKIIANLMQKVEKRFYGKYRGFVVDNADPENLGRLKLTVPSVLGTEVVTGWATPCLPFGGQENQGFLFVPEIDAGVWVEFEEGDLEFPIWVGTYWSKPGGESELPKPNGADGEEEGSVQDPPTRKIIKMKKGHTIQFEDKDGEEMVIIVQKVDDSTWNLIKMDGEGVEIADGVHGHKVVLDSDGITMASGGNVTISGATINIEGDDITVKAKQTTTVEAPQKLALKGQPIHLNPES